MPDAARNSATLRRSEDRHGKACRSTPSVAQRRYVTTTAYLVGRYVETLGARRCSPETIRTVRSVLTMLSSRVGKRLDEITHDDLTAWQAARAREVQGRTLRKDVVYVRGFYTWCVLEGHLRDDPALRLRTPKVPLTQPRPINEQRLAHALDGADPVMAAILGLAAFAGLRACEIARLEWADCYLDEDEPYLRVLGKGDRERIADVSLELRDLLIAVPGWPAGRRVQARRRAAGAQHGEPDLEARERLLARRGRPRHAPQLAAPVHHGDSPPGRDPPGAGRRRGTPASVRRRFTRRSCTRGAAPGRGGRAHPGADTRANWSPTAAASHPDHESQRMGMGGAALETTNEARPSGSACR
jgi:integrase